MERRIGPFGRITIFGGVTLDRIARSDAEPVPGASNPGTARTLPGGVGLNLATSLARLGHAVRLVARVGGDPDGEAVIAAAGAAGLETGGISVSPSAPTATYHATLDHLGGLIVGIADMRINEELTPAIALAHVMPPASDDLWVVDANLAAETLDVLVGEAAAARIRVAALTVSPVKAARLAPLLDRVSLLFTNRREAATLLGPMPSETVRPTPELAADLARLGPELAVVTHGAEPLAAASGSEVRSFVPLRAEVRSVNGAGDALAAGTIHGLALGRTFPEAVMSGLAAAALALESEESVSPRLGREVLAERIGAGVRWEG